LLITGSFFDRVCHWWYWDENTDVSRCCLQFQVIVHSTMLR